MQEEEKLFPIHVWLAGRSYRILVRAGEEQRITESVKAADEKIRELRLHYGGKDDQDFLAMCLIMYATDKKEEAAPAAAPAPDHAISDQLNDLIRRIDTALDEPTQD
jgi:cell division protein ZapA